MHIRNFNSIVAMSCFAIFLFIGCASTQVTMQNKVVSSDIISHNGQMKIFGLSQRAIMYINDSNNFKDADFGNYVKKEYLDIYFSVWKDEFSAPSKEEMFWGLAQKEGFGESKRPLNEKFIGKLIDNMQIDSYPSLKKRAIMVKTADVRLFPTIKPRFSKIDGYPFDRWQNSLIFAFTPVIILHQDKTKEWLLVQSSFVSGWVKYDEVAIINKKNADSLSKTNKFLIPNSDKISLYYNNKFIVNARIGMLFEYKNNKIYGYYRDTQGFAVKVPLEFDRDNFSNFPITLNQINIANVADSLDLQNYGWGGMYGNRDCSSFIRDVFMNFGIWLPRNSMAQVNYGAKTNYSEYIELPSNNEKKIEYIKKYGKPFRTILHLKGHIMLYIGQKNGEIIVMHDVWGASINEEIQILGGISITTLTPGLKEDTNSQKTLLSRILGMNVIIK